MKKTLFGLFISLAVILLSIWLFALIKCEILTILHGNEFKTNYQENTMIGEIDYLKVLQYSDTAAQVYYVTENRGTGEILSFKKVNNEWRNVEWKTVWSGVGGSASDVIWPYWWHFIYGGL